MNQNQYSPYINQNRYSQTLVPPTTINVFNSEKRASTSLCAHITPSLGITVEFLTALVLLWHIYGTFVVCMRAQDLFICGHAHVEKFYVGVSIMLIPST